MNEYGIMYKMKDKYIQWLAFAILALILVIFIWIVTTREIGATNQSCQPTPTITPTPTDELTPTPAEPTPIEELTPTPTDEITPTPTQSQPTLTPAPTNVPEEIIDRNSCVYRDCSIHPTPSIVVDNQSGIPLQPPSQAQK